MKNNYKQLYAIRQNNEKRIEKLCPEIDKESGIYVFYRSDPETSLKFCYCGQAVNLLQRCVQHLTEYDHIAMSLKKHGLKSNKNPNGWQLAIKHYLKEELDDAERQTILEMANKGYQLFNKTAGGQSSKTQIAEYKPKKTYRDGLMQGRINCSREIFKIFDKHLEVSTKKQPPTKTQQKALEKFNDFLEFHKNQTEK